jgi:general secretion pathway protein E
MAQRLIRKLCPHCKVEYQITDEELRELGLDPALVMDRTAYRPGTDNCEYCQNTHYSGRTGIHELLIITDDIRPLILQRMDSSTIKSAAAKAGFETLRIDGGRKVLEGETSVEEVLLATHEEMGG